jgi:gliding motility-associated-like protein
LRHFIRVTVIALTLFLVPGILLAQKESAIWYFGDLAGLDFNFKPPRPISNPNMKTFEGCSSLADTAGNLLFYSDGRTVWNKQHAVMQNGTGLAGDASSTHSSIFIQKPYSISEYYIITADAWPNTSGDQNNGVNYSEIHLDNNSGDGLVVSKNNPLVGASAEKIAITKHRNGTYYWLAIPECFTSNLHLFLITENGFEHKATYTNVFPVLQSSWGQIKFSTDGRHLALTWPQPNNSQLSDVMVLDFNNTTGFVNQSQVISGGDRLYGVEFSPNSQYLYLSTWIDKNKVCQCPVVQGTTNYLTDCKFYPQRNVSGQLQLGPDQKIYIANSSKPYVGVIEFPDSEFTKTGFIDSAIGLLPGTKCFAGLPSLYVKTERLLVNNLCLYDTGNFSISTNSLTVDSIHWFANTTKLPDTLTNARAAFNIPGVYDITVVLFTPTGKDTFSRSIIVKPLPVDPHLQDTAVCEKQQPVLNARREPKVTYLWNTGSSDSAITASTAGNYEVTLTLDGCSVSNNFNLSYKPYPIVSMPDNTVICEGSSTEISAEQPGVSYLWSTGDTSASVQVNLDQMYWVAVTRKACTTRDSFEVRTTVLPQINLGTDTTICEHQPFQLNAVFPYSNYLWSTASTQSAIRITAPGVYTVLVNNPCGSVSDTILISQDVCNCKVWAPNAFTPNGDFNNDLFYPQPTCDYTVFDFRIYNRLGQEIFKSNSPVNAWNGTYKGEPMPCDAYVWQLSYTLVNKAGFLFSENINGTVTLLR